ncbi:glutamate rich 3-like isoform X2 [Syngnathoides biaculeatus]|uniref:glutamate rich 3-like isoform X2 n=1 Tax=Syngnathoides biaculeatus TaxID=300417 RepID=UPI002ADD5F9A|nr:glutamate rich 3-like isoform X2 [Syngnathoides biaculeatus]
MTQLDDPTARSRGANKDDIYLPAITRKASNFASTRGSLSQSCPYLNHRRRGSLSSVSLQKTRGYGSKQSYLNAQREAKKSNVTVTMLYLGQGHRGSRVWSSQDELKVLQQVNRGENICVFKGWVTPGDLFTFVSQRHRGFPFSASLYVNGMKVARLSSCCEYRYAPGFQQGKKSCFRLSWLTGGIPCHRCTSLRNKYSSCQKLNDSTKESLFLSLVHSSGNVESCPSSPVFIPTKLNIKSAGRTRRHGKDKDGGSTDSEEPPAAAIKESSKKRRRKSQTNQSVSKDKTATSIRRDSEISRRPTLSQKYEGQVSSARQELEHKETTGSSEAQQIQKLNINKTSNVLDLLQDEEVLTKQTLEKPRESNGKSRNWDGRTDFYEQCVQMSVELEKSPSKHNWLQANMLQRRRLQKRLALSPKAPNSDVEQ